jgi:hypothetical protein
MYLCVESTRSVRCAKSHRVESPFTTFERLEVKSVLPCSHRYFSDTRRVSGKAVRYASALNSRFRTIRYLSAVRSHTSSIWI